MNINANISECVKKVEGIGSDTYQNICTGSKAVVPWGAIAWIDIFTLGIVLVAIMLIMTAFIRIILDP